MSNHESAQVWDREVAARNVWVDHMLAYTARLVRLQEASPKQSGSGILYARDSRIFLFSVLHVFEQEGWFLETGTHVEGKDGGVLIKVPPVNWLADVKLDENGLLKRLSPDAFAWVEFDVNTLSKKLAADSRGISLSAYCGPLDYAPNYEEPYSFVAAPIREHHTKIGGDVVFREPLFELDMRYGGQNKEGLCRFRLAGRHRGHDFYRGSSGAPIADREGTIVAFVQGGHHKENIIYGVPIARYHRALELAIC